MLDNKKLQAIRDQALGVTGDPRNYGDLNSTVYLQQILDGLLGVGPTIRRGNLNEKIYLQKIRNVILGVPDGQFGGLPNSVYLQQIINAGKGVKDGQFGSLDEGEYLDNIVSGGLISHLLRDDFTDTCVAGTVNGKQATPLGGARVAVDTNSKISVGSDLLNFATGNAANDGVWWGAQTRVAGKALFAKATWSSGASVMQVGFTNAQSGATAGELITFNATLLRCRIGGTNILTGELTLTTPRFYSIVLRSSGGFHFVKGDTYSNWTLLYPTIGDGTVTMYPVVSMSGANMVGNVNYVRIPQPLVLVSPVASDSFNRANGAIGTTDGSGTLELGGSGLVWAKVGTWNIATNKAACAALVGGIGNAVVGCGTPNVIVEAVITRSSGNAGLLLRYTDENNYIKAYLDGTNLVIVEIVGGTPNTLSTTAVTYGATNRTVLSASGAKIRAYYNEALVGSEVTTALTTGNGCGLHTTHTGATFDSFAVWAKGNEGQYAFSKYAPG